MDSMESVRFLLNPMTRMQSIKMVVKYMMKMVECIDSIESVCFC